jgi:hypothetical protein
VHFLFGVERRCRIASNGAAMMIAIAVKRSATNLAFFIPQSPITTVKSLCGERFIYPVSAEYTLYLLRLVAAMISR